MKKTLSAITITLLGIGPVLAQETAAPATTSAPAATTVPADTASTANEDLLWTPIVDLRDLSATITLGFEGEYVFRGSRQGDESIQSSLDLSMPLYEGDLNFGVWNNNDLRSNSTTGGAAKNDDEIDLYASYAHPLTDDINVEVGYTHYWYPDAAAGNVTSTNEVSLGFTKDYYVLWGATGYYDFDLEQIVMELSTAYSYSLKDYGFPRTSIDCVAYYGVVDTHEVNGSGNDNGYSYGGANLDIVYILNDVATVSVGGRFAMNNDDSGPANGIAGGTDSEDSLWVGASVSMGF